MNIQLYVVTFLVCGGIFLASYEWSKANSPVDGSPSVIQSNDTNPQARGHGIVQAQSDDGGDTSKTPNSAAGDDSGIPSMPNDSPRRFHSRRLIAFGVAQ